MVCVRRWTLALACIVACGPDEASPPAELDEVCGEPSPFRLLELDEDEQLVPFGSVFAKDERLYFIVGPVVGPEDLSENAFFPVPTVETTRVIATGPCGESPVEIGRDIFRVFEHERFPGQVLGCRQPQNADLLVLDPTGREPPRTVMLAPACRGTWTDHGIIGVADEDEPTAALMLVPYPSTPQSEPVAPVVLAESVRSFPWQVVVDEVFAATPSGELLRIALPSGNTAVERPDVETWDLSQDGRILLWRQLSSITEVDGYAVGTVVLRDRMLGTHVEIEDAWLSGRILIESLGYAAIELGTGLGPTRLVRLSDFTSFDLPVDRQIVNPMADGRLLTGNSVFGPYQVRELDTGNETVLADVQGISGQLEGHLEVRAGDTSSAIDDRELWRVPYDGSAASKLAHRVTAIRLRLDERIVALVSIDDHWIGELVIIEPETLEEQAIDDHVFAYAPLIGEGVVSERDVVYAVTDGERSGVWIARLLP